MAQNWHSLIAMQPTRMVAGSGICAMKLIWHFCCVEWPLSSVTSIEHPDFGMDIATILDFTSPEGCNIRVAMDYLAPSLTPWADRRIGTGNQL